MDIKEIVTITISIITAIGGFETIKWWLNRKNHNRISNADAEIAEVKSNVEEFHYWKERVEVVETHNKQLDEQLIAERTRYHEQTLLVRKLNEQLLDRADEIADLRENISALNAERAMKLCERKGCKDRQPQSGY